MHIQWRRRSLFAVHARIGAKEILDQLFGGLRWSGLEVATVGRTGDRRRYPDDTMHLRCTMAMQPRVTVFVAQLLDLFLRLQMIFIALQSLTNVLGLIGGRRTLEGFAHIVFIAIGNDGTSCFQFLLRYADLRRVH